MAALGYESSIFFAEQASSRRETDGCRRDTFVSTPSFVSPRELRELRFSRGSVCSACAKPKPFCDDIMAGVPNGDIYVPRTVPRTPNLERNPIDKTFSGRAG